MNECNATATEQLIKNLILAAIEEERKIFCGSDDKLLTDRQIIRYTVFDSGYWALMDITCKSARSFLDHFNKEIIISDSNIHLKGCPCVTLRFDSPLAAVRSCAPCRLNRCTLYCLVLVYLFSTSTQPVQGGNEASTGLDKVPTCKILFAGVVLYTYFK